MVCGHLPSQSLHLPLPPVSSVEFGTCTGTWAAEPPLQPGANQHTHIQNSVSRVIFWICSITINIIISEYATYAQSTKRTSRFVWRSWDVQGLLPTCGTCNLIHFLTPNPNPNPRCIVGNVAAWFWLGRKTCGIKTGDIAGSALSIWIIFFLNCP